MTLFATYNTITLTNASAAVTVGSGALTTDGVQAGDLLVVIVSGAYVTLPILSVESDSALTLDAAWTGSTAGSLTGFFVPLFGSASAAQTLRLMNEYVRELRALGANFDFVSTAAPDDGTGIEGQTWYRISTGEVFVKAASTWGSAVDTVKGADGLGWTGGSYNAGTGKVTFASDDGLGFETGDLRGADGTISSDASIGDMRAMTQAEYDALDPKVTTTLYFIKET